MYALRTCADIVADNNTTSNTDQLFFVFLLTFGRTSNRQHDIKDL